ncbi:MAG: alternate-type signal peptide domain-containing protein, partial [Microbacteriaceae bacterium]|nr:alternate-type signal peptide domain-containing protein [Microbacteriaceae bacterium]
MNKLFKGAVAGAAGVALLLGGAGTFALWNTDMPIGDSQTITAGTLAWANPGTGTWLLNGQAVDPSTALLVPGDVLTYTVTGATYTATGDYIAGTIGADWAGLAPGGSGADADFYSNLDVSITVGGTDVTNTTIDLTPRTGVAFGT